MRPEYDALVIGGGPAGLSAAIAIARAHRSVVLFDRERPGRSDYPQINFNYLGFPDGIAAMELLARGRKQAERFGAEIHEAEVARLERQEGGFRAETGGGEVCTGRAVVLATGVRDRWPEFPGYEEYVGRTMHWCIVCDGCEMAGQRVVAVGNDDDAAETAMQLRRFTPDVAVVTNAGALGLTPEAVTRLERRGIPLFVDCIVGARSRERGVFAALKLARGEEVPLDHLFSQQGSEPNDALGRSLGLRINADGYLEVDVEGRTSEPRIYAAGDVTRLFAQQIATAAHEGATAAAALAYDLWREDEGI